VVAGFMVVSGTVAGGFGFVVQRQEREAFGVLEVALVQREEEQQHSPADEDEADEDQHDQDVHALLRAERRKVVSDRKHSEESGISTAATSGLTWPAKHSATTTAL